MLILEFLIPRRPLSQQAKNRKNYQAWKRFVAAQAARVWAGRPVLTSGTLHLEIVYLCGRYPPDTDNIIKPIQDALVGLIFEDDSIVEDVECHRRTLTGAFDLTRLPAPLLQGLLVGAECVYVRLSDTIPLEDLL